MTSSEEQAIREKLKAEPRYAMRFVPAVNTLTLSRHKMQTLLSENAVRLRGWDLPHEHGMQNAQDYIFNAVDWGMHLEFWRFYKSGQFVAGSSFWDLRDDLQPQLRKQFEKFVITATAEQKHEVRLIVGFIGMIYSVTEYYLFASRLARSLEIIDFSFELSLHNIENTALVPGDPTVPWHAFYRCAIDTIRINADGHTIVSDPLGASVEGLEEIFECYQWVNSQGAIRHWQERFMAGRYAF